MRATTVKTHTGFCRKCRKADQEIRERGPKWCRECYSNYLKDWREKKEDYQAYIREAVNKHRKNNPGSNMANKKRYNKTLKGRAVKAAEKSKRRAKKIGNGGSHSADEWFALLEQYNNTCVCCGCNMCKLTKDHIIPISKGGTDYIDNIQPLCMPCNTKKGVNTIDYR